MFRKYLEDVLKLNGFMSFNPGDMGKIKYIEREFNKNIPPSYLDFLELIGHGLFKIWEFNGTGKANIPSIFFDTNREKSLSPNLPKSFYVIADNDDDDISWFMDISDRDENGEAKIKGWISPLSAEEQPQWLKDQETYNSFEEFFRTKIEEAKKY